MELTKPGFLIPTKPYNNPPKVEYTTKKNIMIDNHLYKRGFINAEKIGQYKTLYKHLCKQLGMKYISPKTYTELLNEINTILIKHNCVPLFD